MSILPLIINNILVPLFLGSNIITSKIIIETKYYTNKYEERAETEERGHIKRVGIAKFRKVKK